MPRRKREESPTGVYHWIVRGINKKHIFHDLQDYQHFKSLLAEYKSKFSVLIYHYCLMTNHVHLLIRTKTLKDLSQLSHFVQRRYAYYYCGRYKWTGSIFQQGFRSFPIDRDEYLLECGRYIERNPLKAGMIKQLDEYEHTSFRFYINEKPDELLTPSPAYLGLASSNNERSLLYERYVLENRLQEEMIQRGLLLV